MSTFLYALGHAVARHRWRSWSSGCCWPASASGSPAWPSGAAGQRLHDPRHRVPARHRHAGERFPQASGTTGQLVFSRRPGRSPTSRPRSRTRSRPSRRSKHVSSVDDPFASGAVGTISHGQEVTRCRRSSSTCRVTDLSPTRSPTVEKAATTPTGARLHRHARRRHVHRTGAGVGLTEPDRRRSSPSSCSRSPSPRCSPPVCR